MERQQFERTARLIGPAGVECLRSKRVAIFGIGGVGSFTAEALVRAGIGRLLFVDGDVVDVTNINRQLVALHSTVGMPKAEVMRLRALEINPEAQVEARQMFYTEANADSVDFSQFDYIVDAIDMITSNLLIIQRARDAGTKVISAMGAGNKLDPTRFRVADISKTSVCPLARVMRQRLRKLGIEHLKVVYSDEPPLPALDGARAPGSISFVPSAAGLAIAGAVVRDLLNE